MRAGFGVGVALLLAAALGGGCGRQGAQRNGPEREAASGHEGHAHERHAAAPDSAAPDTAICEEHAVRDDECGICDPDRVARLAPGQGMKVRLPAAESAAMIGVRAAKPTIGATAGSLRCLAEITFNQNRLARIAAPVGGVIRSVEADLGTRVKEGQPVARIWSAAIADAVARAVLSHQTLERERKLRAEGITPEKDLQEAEAAHRAACQQARTLGFSERDVDAMRDLGEEPVYLVLRAPFSGEIVERSAVRGALVEAGGSLLTVADRRTMWAILHIPEPALGGLRAGQEVEVGVDGLAGRVFAGRLTWVGAQVDERSRMALARAEVPNPDGALRHGMFAQAEILTRAPGRALLVPADAVHRVEGAPVVFVKLADDLYEARAVRLGSELEGRYEILAGLRPEESVVVARGFALKSQLLISRLGAGCADD